MSELVIPRHLSRGRRYIYCKTSKEKVTELEVLEPARGGGWGGKGVTFSSSDEATTEDGTGRRRGGRTRKGFGFVSSV